MDTLAIVLLILTILILVIIIICSLSIKLVRQGRAFVVERLGKFNAVWQNGLHFKLPLADRIAKKVSLKEQVLDFPPQPVITKDNVTMQIDTVIYFQIVDPKSYVYGVEQPISAIENLTATTLRNIIGELDLDQALTSREFINSKMRAILDEATDPWGIKVIRVELKNIMPPKDIREAMEKQMRAEREKRESILIAEGQKQAKILEAQGYKESKILQAEADKQAMILEAEAEAAKIVKIQTANADAIKIINEAKPSKELLTLKSYEAMVEVSKGSSNKLIIPSNMQEIVGLAKSVKFAWDENKEK